MGHNRILVSLDHKLYVYSLDTLKVIEMIETCDTQGIIAMCGSLSRLVFACPGRRAGHVRVVLPETERKDNVLLEAHNGALAALALSADGNQLATTSEKGTLVRLWDTATGQQLHQLRRGADPARIYSLSFSPTAEWLALTSDKGTLHVFSLATAKSKDEKKRKSASESSGAEGGENKGTVRKNTTSRLSFLQGFLPSALGGEYIGSEWAFATYRLPDAPSIVAFGLDPHTLIIVSKTGTAFKVAFDPDKPGSECTDVGHVNFLKTEDESA